MLWEKTKRGEKKGGLRITLLNMLSHKLYLPIVRKVTQHSLRADPNAPSWGTLRAESSGHPAISPGPFGNLYAVAGGSHMPSYRPYVELTNENR